MFITFCTESAQINIPSLIFAKKVLKILSFVIFFDIYTDAESRWKGEHSDINIHKFIIKGNFYNLGRGEQKVSDTFTIPPSLP